MFQQFSPFLTALVIGLLIGVERERSQSKKGLRSVLGARTLPLIGLLGALTAAINQTILLVIISVFVCLIVLLNDVRWDAADRTLSVAGTSAMAAIITFVLGYMAHDNGQLAVILGVVVFGVLAIRNRLREFVRTGISRQEMSAAVTFLISAFVILPLLPNDYIDPWGLIHPTRIWLLFVLIAGVQFFSYIALRQMGQKWGLLLTGFLGGFVSATATTLGLAIKSKTQSTGVMLSVGALVLAEVSSLLIQIMVVAIIADQITWQLTLLLGIPAAVGILIALTLMLVSRNPSDAEDVPLSVDNPISLKSTLTFAALISLGLIVIALAARILGSVGVMITSALGGFASLRVVTFSVTELFNVGEILMPVAALAILLAMTTNIIMKLIIIARVGSMRLFYASTLAFGMILLSGYGYYYLIFAQH
ncbi:MgtC/SapB family protein [Marinicella meishanensis]|uniref:MgtC/SapB family protein n=1 Tax=Marinicella meishanensis TaxID=2873263 RepID=UPI001CBD90DA|nr:DUF4010 domain-containing protein [Marinicella sp. NBU2979]